MMKRVLLCLALVAAGVAPALADPRPERGGRGPDYPRGEGEDRPAMPRHSPFRGVPGFDGGRAMEMGDYDRPPPIRHRADQDRARDQMRAGAIRPLRDIQEQWRQGMPGYDYLGSDYDPGAGSYRLKFLRDGSVLWIDVDGRTGREIGRRGR